RLWKVDPIEKGQPDFRKLTKDELEKYVRNVANHGTMAAFAVAFSPDGQRIASGSGDQTVQINSQEGSEAWASGREDLPVLLGHTDAVLAVAFSHDGQHLASAGRDRTVKIWDPKRNQGIVAFTDHSTTVLGVAFSPDGERLASASLDETVRVWDPATGKPV